MIWLSIRLEKWVIWKYIILLLGHKFSNIIWEKIDIILEHNNNEVEINFGSTLKEDSYKHIYGIGNVMIYIK